LKYKELFPSLAVREDYIKIYLNEAILHLAPGDELAIDLDSLDAPMAASLVSTFEVQRLIISRKFVFVLDDNKLQRVLQYYLLASHLFWGTWAVYQAANSSIDFDFLNYARVRYEWYFTHKKSYQLVW